MKYFTATYESGSLAKASIGLSITAQGLGRAISHFEQQLGIRLFTRTYTGVVPTTAAQRIYVDCKQILATERDMRKFISEYNAGSRRRFVGKDSEIGDCIRRGMEDYNKDVTSAKDAVICELTDKTDLEIAELMQNGACDYRFVDMEFDTLPWLVSAYIGTAEYVAFVNAGSELVGKGVLQLDELAGYTVLSESPSYTYVRLLEKYFGQRVDKPEFRYLHIHYILKLIQEEPTCVFFTRVGLMDDYLSLFRNCLSMPVQPKLRATVVLQTTHGSIDERLVECVRRRLSQSHVLSLLSEGER